MGGKKKEPVDCGACDGTGLVYPNGNEAEQCGECDGSGKVPQK